MTSCYAVPMMLMRARRLRALFLGDKRLALTEGRVQCADFCDLVYSDRCGQKGAIQIEQGPGKQTVCTTTWH